MRTEEKDSLVECREHKAEHPCKNEAKNASGNVKCDIPELTAFDTVHDCWKSWEKWRCRQVGGDSHFQYGDRGGNTYWAAEKTSL